MPRVAYSSIAHFLATRLRVARIALLPTSELRGGCPSVCGTRHEFECSAHKSIPRRNPYSIGEAQHSQDLDAPPGGINLKPAQPMARRIRERVVIIVPSFPPRDQCHPPAVG